VFYLALGLKINIQKSNVSGIGVSDVDFSSMASNSGCASGSFPFTYLGLPIGSNMSLTSSWQEIYCPSCNGNVESLNHIFFECNIAKDIWTLVRKWCAIYFPPFTSYEHWKGWFSSWQVVKDKSQRLSVIFSSSLWWLWRYRNSVIFCSHPMRKNDIFDNIRLSSYSWLHQRGHMICNWIDWLKSPMLLSSNGLE
ncbi:hypothetical protein Tco_1445596, partial [Tanacetum coccineum]